MFKLEILQDTKIVKLIIIIIRETDPEIKHEGIYSLSIQACMQSFVLQSEFTILKGGKITKRVVNRIKLVVEYLKRVVKQLKQVVKQLNRGSKTD